MGPSDDFLLKIDCWNSLKSVTKFGQPIISFVSACIVIPEQWPNYPRHSNLKPRFCDVMC